jgi:hypothetical protein
MSSIAQILIDKWEGNAPALREDYRNKLQHGTWIVEFTKTDGTPATMECTLDPLYLPPANPDSQGRPEQDHLLHVYSVDRAGWRSFVVENVKSFYRKPEAL